MKKLRKQKVQTSIPFMESLTFKRNLKIFLFTFICSVFSMGQVFAQQKEISGVVNDENGQSLPGVNVIIKGTTTGTITNFDGVYNLSVDETAVALEFSFVGYLAEEMVIGDQSKIDVSLVPDMQDLSEVVVVGYTTKKKGELTGSVSTINTEEIARTSSNDLTKSLSGKVSGLIVQDKGGYPGSTDDDDFTLLIRGKSTLNNNAPLIIIDGLRSNGFSHLAPSDIASLTVLKDGAAAIYGAAAANGVIVITTNRGKTGKAVINFTSSYKVSEFTRTPKMMESWQYATYKNEINERLGYNPEYSDEDIDKYKNSPDNLLYPNTDWVDLTLRDYAPETRNTLTVSGGTERIKYFVSGDAVDQGGMYESDLLKYKRYQVRSNLDIKVWEKFKVGVDLSANKMTRTEPSVNKTNIYKAVFNNQPNMVGMYDNGKVAKGGENGLNPLMLTSSEAGSLEHDNSQIQSRFTFDWDLDYITDGLSMNGAAYYKINNEFRKTFNNTWTVYDYNNSTGGYDEVPGYIGENTKAVEDFQRKTEDYQLNLQLNYSKTFSGGHNVSAFVAHERAYWGQSWFSAYGKDLLSAELPDLFSAGSEGLISNGYRNEGGRSNYFGSASYGYKGKYLIDFTLRYDGSDKFAKGNRFGTFPGVSVGWVMSEEGFMAGTSSWLSNLKLRGSWAIMGNDKVPNFQYMSRYTYGGTQANGSNWNPNFYTYGETPVLYDAFHIPTEPNALITWEKADMKNVGLTFGFFESRLSGDVNYYFQKRTDILVRRDASVPDYTGFGQLPQENFGEVNSFGWELELGWNDKIGEFNYNIGGNFTKAKNEVVYLDEASNIPDYQKREGYSMDSYLLYQTEGLYRSQAEVDADPDAIFGALPGDINYIDTNEDGVIDANDMVRRHSSAIPEIQYGIFANLEYKGFGLNILFQGQANSEIEIFYDGENRPEFWFDNRWTEDNPGARLPRAFASGDPYNAKDINYYSPRTTIDTYLFNAAFLRLKELELNYTLPSDLIKWVDIRLFARGSNLATFDNIGWVDPEMPAYHSFRAGLYPPLRSYTFGINAKF